MSEMNELLPCPFCGGAAEFDDEPLMVQVQCTQCECMTACHGDRREAAYAWNTRAALAPSVAPGFVPQWQPIETAPKDGLIDIWANDRRFTDCYRDPVCSEYRCLGNKNNLITLPLRICTHWMRPPSDPLSARPEVPAAPDAVGGEALSLFDAAVAAELPRVSALEYSANEICKYFAENLRKRIAAHPAPTGQADALTNLREALAFLDQVRAAPAEEQVTNAILAREASEWVEHAARNIAKETPHV